MQGSALTCLSPRFFHFPHLLSTSYLQALGTHQWTKLEPKGNPPAPPPGFALSTLGWGLNTPERVH